ncbi:MAG: FAD-binding oxidoreductase [Candidatus Woesearchaeota archaeon]
MNNFDKLKDIVGPENFSTSLDDLKSYATDASQLEGVVQAIVWPLSVEHVRDIIRLANMREFNVVIRGAGTSLEGSTIPRDSVVIDMNRLNKIIALHRQEHYVMVEPGVTLKKLNDALKNYNLFFPIIPTSSKVCTLGGMVANNSHGVYTHRFGRMADQILELEVVDGSGKILIVKDIHKIIGSEGTLAAIVGIKLKVIPPYNEVSHDILTFKNATEVMDKLKELEKDDSVVSIQYMDKNCSKLLNLYQEDEEVEESEKHLLVIEYEMAKGKPGDAQQLRDLLHKEIHKAKLHHIRQITIPKEKIDAFLKYTRKNKIHTFGNITKGIFQLFFNNMQKKIINETLTEIRNMGGEVMNIGTINMQFLPETRKVELEKLKKQYDPLNLMNRGKIL